MKGFDSFFVLTQVLNNILTVVDRILENSTIELLGSAQIQQASSSRILQALENFVKAVDSISANQTSSTFNLKNLTTELPNIAFSINRDLFTHDVIFVAVRKEGNASVSIITNNRLTEITSEILAIIKIPKETFIEKHETLYSFCFTKPSLFFTEEQLQNINGNKTKTEQVVDSNVLSASILRRRVENLSNPIVLTFKKSEQQIADGTLDCQFWNPSLRKFAKLCFFEFQTKLYFYQKFKDQTKIQDPPKTKKN